MTDYIHKAGLFNNKDELLSFLYDLGNCDEDFNGNNGDDYLNENAKKLGFETNRDYSMSLAQEKDNYDEIITTYLDSWIGDDYYYQGYDYTFIYDNKDEIVGVSIMILVEDQ